MFSLVMVFNLVYSTSCEFPSSQKPQIQSREWFVVSIKILATSAPQALPDWQVGTVAGSGAR